MKAISIHCLICKLLVCGAWMWMSTLVSSQRATISFEHFTSNEGLSAPVNQITQDQYGFIWLGTTDGLNRFDGRNFVVYRNVPGDTTSLPNNIINALCVDRIGHVWIATNGGLCYYDFEDDAFHQVEFADTVEKLDRHRVHAVAADPFGNIWFATRTHLHRWHDHEAVISIPVPGDESLQLRYLYADDHKQVWLGMNTGIIRYDVNTQHFTILPITSPFTIEKNLTVTVSPIIPYKGDTLLIGSWYGGLQKIFPTGNSIGAIPYTDQAESDPRKHIIRGVSPGANGIYWVGSYGNGLSVFDSRTSAFTAHYHHDPSNERSLSDDYINSVFTDKSGIVWIGTEIGLDKFDPFTQQFQSISIPTFSGEFSVYRMPNTIVEDPNHQGHLWFSVSGAGIYEYNPATDAFSVHRADPNDPHGLPENTVYTLYRDHSGRQWVGMKSGICLASPDLRRYEPLTIFGHEPTPSIHIILESADGSFWFGSFSNGVYHYDERTKKLDHYAHDDAVSNTLPDNRVFCMIADHLGYIWIGTQNRGLCRLDPKTGQFTFFVHDKSSNQAIPDNGIYDLYEDPAHKLWIATENGLAVMDLGDFSMTNFSTQDGLCNNDVFSITPDGQGNLWLATNNGMSRFNPSNKSFKNYFINDGLPINRLSGAVFLTRDGKLFIGTTGMLTYCQPEMMQMNRQIPSVVITNFKVFDQPLPVMRAEADLRPIRLSYKQNMITLDFAALNFTNSYLNQYAYRLQGFDDHWIYCGNKQSATFTNLDGGTYTFQVKAANNDGVWNDEGAKVEITVNPPFWETWWFYIACFVTTALILYSAYQFRIRQLMRLQQVRLRISRDLHDDIGSTLSSINMISSMAHEHAPNEKKVPELFQTISNASSQAMELMSDIVWSINPKNDRMEMILIRMRQYASEILEAAGINFQLDMDHACNSIALPIEKRKDFYLIFKEAINNMAKYSNADQAHIHLACSHRGLALTIRDNGQGFNPEEVHSGNGLKNMRARAQQLKGLLTIGSSLGRGTTIDLQIPLTP